MNPRTQTMVRTLMTLLIVSVGTSALAQSYEVKWYTIDGGGEMFSVSASETYVLGGTIGQPDAGASTSETYALKGGFWPVALPGMAKRPMGEDCYEIDAPDYLNRCSSTPTCSSDNDCWEESHCVPPPADQPDGDGVCYAPKARYLSIARHEEQAPHTARRVRLNSGEVLGWIGEPRFVEPLQDPEGFWLAGDANTSGLVSSPVYAGVDFDGDWPEHVHVIGCEIAHASLCDDGSHCRPNECPPPETCEHDWYHVQAIQIGENTAYEYKYSEVLELRTNTTWGDMVSTCQADVCRPPNGLVGLDDIMAAIGYFQGTIGLAPLTWLDIAPSQGCSNPDQIVGLDDIMSSIAGFQGEAYPGLGPADCDGCP